MLEKQIENQILEYLSFKKIFCWKCNSVGVYDPVRKIYRKPHSPFIITGICDILGILDSRFLAIEVKTPMRRNNLTDKQRDFIERINQGGGIAFVATSVEDVKNRLNI